MKKKNRVSWANIHKNDLRQGGRVSLSEEPGRQVGGGLAREGSPDSYYAFCIICDFVIYLSLK